MSRLAKRAHIGLISQSGTSTLATCPTGKKWEIVDVFVTNGAAVTRTVSVYVEDGSSHLGNFFFRPNMAASTQEHVTCFVVMNAGDTIKSSQGVDVYAVISVIEVDV